MDPPHFHSQTMPRNGNFHAQKKNPYWIPSYNRSMPSTNMSHTSSECESDDSGRSSSASSNASKGTRRNGELGPVRVNYNYQATGYYNNSNNHFIHHSSNYPVFPYYNSLNFIMKRRFDGNRATMTMLNNLKFPSATLQYLQEMSPDKLLAKSHLVEIKEAPYNLKNGSKWDQLSEQVWNKFVKSQQTEETFQNKMAVWKHLYINIKNAYPHYSLYLVGSTITGFGSNKSDMDLCLVVGSQETISDRFDALRHLETISRLIRRLEGFSSVQLINAKVPILKFRDTCYNLEIDLNCNNTVGIRNTHLLYSYAQLNWRVRPLVLVIKLWAQYRGINNPKNKTISSYSLELMVIYYLQSVGVLPCLQMNNAYVFRNNQEISQIDIFKNSITHESLNSQTLGELLLGFLKYYAKFNYTEYTISVRLGEITLKSSCISRSLDRMHEWKYLCIEEPFDLTNTARSVYDPYTFNIITHVIQDAAARLEKDMTLTVLLPP